MKKKYFFTPQMDDVVREYYAKKLKQPKLNIRNCMERRLGLPGWVCIRRGRDLGLSRTKEKPWTQVELDLLETHIHKAADVIARTFRRNGFHRTATAIHLQRKRKFGGIKQNLAFYTANQVALLLGVDRHKVGLWIRSAALCAERRGTERTEQQGGDMWMIYPASLKRFLVLHPLEFDLRKVDQLWFMDLVAGGAALSLKTANAPRGADA